MTILVSKRARLLAGVATSVFATAFAGAASAGSTTIDTGGDATVVGHKTVISEVFNSAAILTSITNEVGGISVEGTQTGTTNTVTENAIEASSTANAFSNAIDLSLIANDVADGAASLANAVNAGTVQASVVNSGLGIDLLGFVSGSAVNDDNTISASAMANSGSTSIAGAVPNGYVSTAAGASTSTATTPLDAAGSIVASSVQDNQAAANTAQLLTNTVSLVLSAETDNNVDSSPTVDGNTLSAATTINSATTGISIEAGDAPAFSGSAVATNLQSNVGSASALNSASTVVASIVGETPAVAVNDLDGGLSVQDNTISASAVGNKATGLNGAAGNSITVGDQLAINGAGTAAPGAALGVETSAATHDAAADFIVANNQSNVGSGANIYGQTGDARILAYVQSLEDGAITVASNAETAAATGNTASNALTTGDDLSSFTASAAMTNAQSNAGNTITAQSINTEIVALTSDGNTGVTSGSTITVDSNRVAATAYGNDVSQSIALEANTLNPGYGIAAVTGGVDATDGANAVALGNITVSNLQSREGSQVTATVFGSEIGLDADTRNNNIAIRDEINDSTLSTTSNRQEAVALGSSVSNGLSLSGNTVGTGAAVTSVQAGDETSAVTATLESASAGLIASTHVGNSTLDVTGNLQRAIAYAGSASNSLSAEANTLTGTTAGGTTVSIDGTSLPFYDGTVAQPGMTAALGVLNDQSAMADVTASAEDVLVGLSVEGDLLQSSAALDSNAIVGAAYGVDASNTLGLDVGSLDVDAAGGAFAQIANTQAVGGTDTDIAASAYGLVQADIEDDVTGSSLSVSSNTLQAQSIATQATNTLTASGNAFDTSTASATGASVGVSGDVITNTAALGVTNAQSTVGTVSARLTDSATGATDSAKVLTTLGTDVATISDATVASDNNVLSAAAIANAATNSVSFEGNAIASETGLQNYQTASADMSALIGVEGMAASPGGAFNYGITGNSSIAHTGGEIYAGELYVAITGNALTTAEVQYLISQGWELDSANDRLVWDASATPFSDPSVAVYTAIYNSGSYNGISPQNDVAPDFPGSPNIGGVTIVADGAAIANSTLSVDGNAISGSVTGNSASNTLAIDAGAIASASDTDAAVTTVAGGISAVDADHALSNLQGVEGGVTLESLVYGSFGIETAADVDVSNTSISVSDNSQRSVAVANTAANALSNDLSLDANAISAGSGLLSLQSSAAVIAADSDVQIFAPAAVTGSSVAISGNTNTALAVANDVTNSTSVTGTTIASLDSTLAADEAGVAELDAPTSGLAAISTADHTLTSLQFNSAATVTANADTTIYNVDSAADTSTGLTGSSFTLSGNATYAEASSNRASNTLTLDASSLEYASAGVMNEQTNLAAVTATASSSATLGLNGDTGVAAISNSTVALDDNSTTALARGNSATNVLNVSGGAGFGISTTAATATFGTTTNDVSATYAVLNMQSNVNAISASSTGSIYRVAYNDDTALSGVTGSTISVTGNSVASQAYGNSATNAVVISALNGVSPTAVVASQQYNTAATSASVTGAATTASFGVTGLGTSSGSSFGVTGNSVSARAVGNSVSSSITSASR